MSFLSQIATPTVPVQPQQRSAEVVLQMPLQEYGFGDLPGPQETLCGTEDAALSGS